MVQGTASSAGKSTLVAGLCRLFARRGIRVAPFKAQNMSNNAAVCADGYEIGRAQFAQATAAGVEPTVDMNPILLKPQGTTSQVVVRGEIQRSETAAEYWKASRHEQLWPVVVDALDRLREEYELVIAEGAGSPAEVNLHDRDLVNMRVARHANADVLLVADIDRGGAFASLLGTWEWLNEAERRLVRGFVLNKFRGDPGLLAPAPALLQERTGVPVIGVVPYLHDLELPDEDGASLHVNSHALACVEVAIVRLPHIANFDEFGGLAGDTNVELRYIARPEELRAPDLVILPGTKATIPDLLWLAERGLSGRIRWLAEHGTPVLGVCGGYQMLGATVTDPSRIESEIECAQGLCLLPVHTELLEHKRLLNVHGRVLPHGTGVWQSLAQLGVDGYEMHVGHTRHAGEHPSWLMLQDGPEGSASTELPVVGTNVHGMLQSALARQALLRPLAERRGFTYALLEGSNVDVYDRLADVLEQTLDLTHVLEHVWTGGSRRTARRAHPDERHE
ncbi:MAG: cobyric acid synthase [Chloroflexi bacterium]|nr:cobyric acid synthase [Chloroflexota bacterium]